MVKKDLWVEELKALEQSGDAIMSLISERNQLLRSGGDAYKISGKIRQSQNNFSYDLAALERDLENNHKSKKLSPKEYERRKNLLNEANIRKQQIQKAFENKDRQSLLASDPGISNMGFEPEETEDTVGYSNRELMQQQEQTIQNQDQGLQRIAQIVRRQKEIGIAIGDEIDGQNEILDDLNNRTEATSSRINRQIRGVEHVAVKEGGFCKYWTIIILLFAAIIAVIIWKMAN